MDSQLLTRQAIFNKKQQTVGYEALFANSKVQTFASEDLQNLANKHRVFIDCTDLITHDELLDQLPQDNLVLQFKEPEVNNNAIIPKIVALHKKGYTIALTGVTDKHDISALAPHVDIIKLDTLALDDEQLRICSERFKSYPIKLLAEKVESQAAFKLCDDLGFDYVQGDFLTNPDLERKSLEANNGLMIMQLLNKLQTPDIAPAEVEVSLSQDPRLAYKLFRIINSPAYGLMRKVSSLHEAIIFIGLQQIKRWATLIALSNVEGKPQELMMIALIRAKMCECLAEHYGYDDSYSFFTAGLFSKLDAMFDNDMAELLSKIPVATELKQALLTKQGNMGEILHYVIAYERAEWDEFEGGDYETYMKAYLDSIAWAEDYIGTIS